MLSTHFKKWKLEGAKHRGCSLDRQSPGIYRTTINTGWKEGNDDSAIAGKLPHICDEIRAHDWRMVVCRGELWPEKYNFILWVFNLNTQERRLDLLEKQSSYILHLMVSRLKFEKWFRILKNKCKSASLIFFFFWWELWSLKYKYSLYQFCLCNDLRLYALYVLSCVGYCHHLSCIIN